MAMNTNPKKTLGFADLWQERLSLRYPGEFHKPPTTVERGQLKQLADKVGPETREVIVYAVDNWHEFGHDAKSVKGLALYPTRPRIGFLFAHCEVAVNLRRKAMARERATVEIAKARAEMEAIMAKKAWSATPERVKPTPEERAALREAYLSSLMPDGKLDWKRHSELVGEVVKRFNLVE